MLVIAQSETNKKECQDKVPVIFTLCFYHCRETILTKDSLQLQETSRMFWGFYCIQQGNIDLIIAKFLLSFRHGLNISLFSSLKALSCFTSLITMLLSSPSV